MATPLATPINKDAFNATVFEKAITGKKLRLAVATAELDKCIDNEHELRQVYGVLGETGLNETPLFLLLQSPQYKNRDEAKQLLEHTVMRKVIMLKWKIFGMRMYMEQALMYLLLLMTLTLSVSMDVSDDDAFPAQLSVWLYIGLGLVTALIATYFFKYSHRALWWTCVLAIVLLEWLVVRTALSPFLHAHVVWPAFVYINNVLLAIVGVYFLRFELNEMFGELSENHREFDCGIESLSPRLKKTLYYIVSAPFMVVAQFLLMLLGHVEANYYQSDFNKVQLPTFIVLVVYAAAELIMPFKADARLCVGIGLTFLTWALSVQYLEVHGTAGYLIPMMKRMLHDVYRFMAFYIPFQCAYAFAYYLLFQDQENADGYDTIPKSFVTTFLVMLGQIETGPFDELADPTQYVLGYTLLLTHATLVIVMLLNVLVAMMTKSVDGGMEKAKREALVSFAECILRSEKTTGLMPLPENALPKRKLTELEPLVVVDDAPMYLEAASSKDLSDEPEDDGLGFKPDDKSSDELVEELAAEVASLKDELAEMRRDMREMLQLLKAMSHL
ncbi:hypothetical protein SPRG_10913 [Saprolegnia parasitica CBS 223.65]|uniref:Polycystin cation channel PKD1/PKD2 domain-containing protein n=1 Tax=Saprolegnia parasitica (strain CBS 223.65) TaxID=695850 RepID=A0A067C4R8_SAPPC|nr:hypothetical protein SPRG_10913 [Saprolegnia parasitica CBS 223.65]KDO24125.1 hypothetical protein SPRG_10913 [Saprolegnia parasitica CBS 223.65]|eukprot:XP_012205260.1 hypothetical protein SPRG_10913 [Saprolegnia parasitica CBS 223.65]